MYELNNEQHQVKHQWHAPVLVDIARLGLTQGGNFTQTTEFTCGEPLSFTYAPTTSGDVQTAC